MCHHCTGDLVVFKSLSLEAVQRANSWEVQAGGSEASFVYMMSLKRHETPVSKTFHLKTSFSPQAKEAGADDILDISKCELSEVNRA